MFYLIRLDFRPGGASSAEVREIWRRSAAAMREPGGSETVRGFKVVGQQTIFALAEFADNGAVDDALARLSNVDGLGDAAEVEFMAVRTYDEPGASGDTATEIAGEPAASGPAEGGASPDTPALAVPEAATEQREDEDVAHEVLVPPEREASPTSVPTEDASVTGAIRALDREPAPSGPEEQGSEPVGPARPETDRQPEGSITGVIRSLDTPGQPPDEPAADHDPAGQAPPSQEPVVAETAPPELETPVEPSVTGLIRGLDSPGRASESQEQGARTGAGQDRVPAGPQEQDAGAPAQPGPPPEHSADPSITGLIRSLVSPGGAPGEPGGPTPPAGDEPAEPASYEAGRQPEGPAPDPNRGPETARPEADQDQDTAIGPEGPEGSITAMIRILDAPGLAPPASEPARPAAPSGPRVLLRPVGGPEGEVLEIGQAGATMGRSPDNAIQISDGRLSRRHAQIEFKEGAFWLTDLDSSNGTFVNQARVEAPHRLRTGDVITLGATRLGVTLEGTAG